MAKSTKVTNQITKLRKDSNVSQSELGDHIGVSRQTVNAIEASKYSPSLEAAFKIARFFGLPIEEVFFYPDLTPHDERTS